MNWPSDTRESQKEHCLARVANADKAIGMCERKRTAVQAGGNVGLWPMRMAEHFGMVFTFEPEPITYECLHENCKHISNIHLHNEALGANIGLCGIKRRSLASSRIVEGSHVQMTPLDALGLTDVDLIQLDVEGYEFEALKGAELTIQNSRPIIQLELRNLTTKYGSTDEEVRAWLGALGYREVAQVPGSDFIFRHA